MNYITLEVAWEMFPEAMVALDRDLGHLTITGYAHWTRSYQVGLFATVRARHPDQFQNRGTYGDCCIDWEAEINQWTCCARPEILLSTWIPASDEFDLANLK